MAEGWAKKHLGDEWEVQSAGIEAHGLNPNAVKAMKEAGIPAKIVIGGAPVTQEYADKIGADGYAADAASAVDMAKQLIAWLFYSI